MANQVMMIIVPHVHYSSMAFLIVCSAICAVAAALLPPPLLRVWKLRAFAFWECSSAFKSQGASDWD